MNNIFLFTIIIIVALLVHFLLSRLLPSDISSNANTFSKRLLYAIRLTFAVAAIDGIFNIILNLIHTYIDMSVIGRQILFYVGFFLILLDVILGSIVDFYLKKLYNSF